MSWLSALFSKKEPTPYKTGFLPEVDGHRVFYAEYGVPSGVPVIYFHGGPGYFSQPKYAGFFDLSQTRVILFDQRGCGQSDAKDPMAHNTTAHLLDDAKRLLDHLGVAKLAICGGSWGATLALAFAEEFPEMATCLMLRQVFLARAADVTWTAQGTARFYPDIMAQIEAIVPPEMSVSDYYAQLLFSGDVEKERQATRLLGAYEMVIGDLSPALPDNADDYVRGFKIYTHYAQNAFFMDENQLLANAHKIAHLPTLILHNRLDLVCPLAQAYTLSQHLNHATLEIVPSLGHGSAALNARTRALADAFVRQHA